MDLATQTGLSVETIKRLESIRGPIGAHVTTLRALVAAFRELGVNFDASPEGEGVWRVHTAA